VARLAVAQLERFQLVSKRRASASTKLAISTQASGFTSGAAGAAAATLAALAFSAEMMASLSAFSWLSRRSGSCSLPLKWPR
jgi:hypothetical protein